ncbi:6,7-dimethyl-8-ribityllumazine synthase [Candidatus Hodgkinia cicadicola]
MRILVLVSRCHVFLADMALKRVVVGLRFGCFVWDVSWFYGCYELSWLLRSAAARCCACVVIGFVLKGLSDHNVHVAVSVYSDWLRFPVVNAVFALDCAEAAWNKAISLDCAAVAYSLASLLGTSFARLV